MNAVVVIVLVGLPFLLVLAARRGGVRYEWGADALVVRAGVQRRVFPYASTRARLTTVPLGARLAGTAVAGSVTGRFAFGRGAVHALATTTRPDQALLLGSAERTYYVTPDRAAEFVSRFQAA
ncbi:PH domain-containing protein [Deinococcus enclensis]|uniref:Bacterial Pleckstrin homology domain-containing protein n=1 Tax=Deinococcus enclensis TaxID=1049582 RepID=A0ABT9MG36_9DEIO|nr:PH domain-containing protein [Deinococcus enclensis]MDP9765552.1 hypothetical protein [Deinococcus enclensis]